ncbi:MAG: SPOR domain-containing protein [Burkholderiaceae bacterium]|nr:SPOR domain-containing protein [Burkholderiaceae bacterium]
MLRILAIVLLVGNALLLAAQFGAFDRLAAAGGIPSQQREPERLLRQVNPQGMRILPPQAASAALASAAASAAQAAAAASSASALACLEAGPFAAGEAEAAERTLRDAGLAAGSWQALVVEDRGEFIVYMGRFAERELLQRKLDELRRLKIEVEELHGAAALQPGLSLGRYDERGAADAALARLAQRGVRTARVVTLRPAQRQTTLRIAAADATTRARLAGLTMPSGPGFGACAAGAGAAAAAAAASAGASAPGGASASAPAGAGSTGR